MGVTVDHTAIMRLARSPMVVIIVVEMFNAIRMLVKVLLSGLHLDHKVPSSRVHIRWIEDAAVGFESSTGLLPPVLVKLLEVISPFKLELILVIVIAVDLNVVKEDVPWHIVWGQIGAPSMESWRPEVHSQVLRLMHQLDSLVIVGFETPHLIAI